MSLGKAKAPLAHRAWTTYAQELYPLGHGHPMWFPEPEPENPNGVHIGNVGVLNEDSGYFRVLLRLRDGEDGAVASDGGSQQVAHNITQWSAQCNKIVIHDYNIRTAKAIMAETLFSRNIHEVTGEANTGVDM